MKDAVALRQSPAGEAVPLASIYLPDFMQRAVFILHIALPPDRRRKQQYNRENLQPAQQHIHTEHEFGEAGKESKVILRPNHAEPRPHIAQAGHNRGKRSRKVKIIQRNQYKRTQQKQDIHNDIPRYAMRVRPPPLYTRPA